MPTFNRNTPLPWLIVWNQTPSEFDSMVTALRHPSIDYRPISICMHGEQAAPHLPGDRLYSSIWVKRPGPKWYIQSYLSEPQLNSYLAAQKNKGNFPRLIAAYWNNVGGDGFAVVTEEGSPESWVEPMVWGVQLPTRLPQRRLEGFYPRWCAAYGTNWTVSGSLIKYAFVWEKQPNVRKNWWNGFTGNDPSNPAWEPNFGDQFVALTKGFWRPDLVCPIEGSHGFVNNQVHLFGPRYFSLWRDEQLNSWSFHTIATSGLQGLLQGIATYRFPIRLQVAGKKGDPKQFAMLMVAASDEIIPRTFQVQFAFDPQATPSAQTPFKAADEWVRAKMNIWNIRCGQLAIAYKGKLVHASAHTLAEPGYPQLTPTTVMAPGSISKVFTAMLVARFWDQGKLNPFAQSIVSLLGVTPADPNFSSRRVVQLLSHTSGLSPDAALGTWWVPLDAATAFQTLQPTDWHWMQYLLEQPSPAPPLPPGGFFTQPNPPNNAMFSPPPSNPPPASYSGAGMMLAGQCAVRQTPVTTVAQGLKEFLFAPLGIKRPRVIDITAGQAAEDPTVARLHDNPGYAPNNFNLQFDPNGNVVPVGIEPYTYAGPATMGAGAGGWFMAAVDVARLFSHFDVPNNNPLFSSANQWMEATMLYRYGIGWGMGFVVSGYLPSMPTSPPVYSWHNGAGLGANALAVRRNDGVVVVVMFNHGDLNDAMDAIMSISPDGTDLLALVDSYAATEGWPTWDLFHTVDLPEY
jgi:CubicO group peptidase (beta-lactamase class C family)